MSLAIKRSEQHQNHTHEIADIITAPPAWLLRWGITLFLLILGMMLALSSLIRYPDLVKDELRIVSLGKSAFNRDSVAIKSFGGLINLPQNKMSKVKLGQKVLIKLQSYPFEEYGMLVGEVSKISDTPNNDGTYLYEVKIKNEGYLNLRKEVRLKTGMIAAAEIVTEDASLLSRIFSNVKKW